MLAAQNAVYKFRCWLGEEPRQHSCLSDALQTWLTAGGIDDVLGDYRIFLQTVVVLLGDQKSGLPSEAFTVYCGNRRQPLPIGEPGDDGWWWCMEPDIFAAILYNHQLDLEA